MARTTTDTLYLRHDFSQEERLEMGARLAESYNRLTEIGEEAKRMKGQIAERMSGVEATIGSLSRSIAAGFIMENVNCSISYDTPNVGEVTYFDPQDKPVKVRPMTGAERQMELPISAEVPADEAAKSVEESAKNVEGFFGTPREATGDVIEGEIEIVEPLPEEVGDDVETGDEGEFSEEYDVFSDPDPAAAKEATSAAHDAEFADIEQKPAKPRKPRGFAKPTNQTAMEEF